MKPSKNSKEQPKSNPQETNDPKAKQTSQTPILPPVKGVNGAKPLGNEKESSIVKVNNTNSSTMNETKMNISRSMHNISQGGGLRDSLNNKTIKYISNSAPIEITPSEIIFKDIQINQTYEIQVFVRNLTKTARRIRVFQPQSTKFRVDYDMKGGIAAGLAMKLIVTFETQVLEDYEDSMKIVSDNGYEKDIPLHAFSSSGQVIFEPFINLGFIKLGKEKREEILFKNEGSALAKIELKTQDQAELQFDSPTFTIKPGEEYVAPFKYTPKDAGIYRGVIEVSTDAHCLQKHIDINATSVEFTRFIIDSKGNQVSQFDFGTFHYGDKKTIIGFLVNNTPKRYRFKTRFRFGLLYSLDDMTNVQAPNIVGREQTEKIMYCEPSEGMIESYSQIELVFQCQAQVDYQNLLWAQKYSMEKEEIAPKIQDYFYSAIFEFDGDVQEPTILHLSGRGICPMLKLSKTILQFGECQVNDYRDVILKIENRNKDLPVDISIPNVPGFQFEPKRFSLTGGSSSSLIVRFQPKSVGKYKQQMLLKLVQESYDLKVKLYGDASEIGIKNSLLRGPESLPANFHLDSKLIDEDSLQFTSLKKKFDSSSISSYPKYLESILDSTQFGKIEEFKRSFDNRQKYNNELKEQRSERMRKEKDIVVQQKFFQMKAKLKQLGLEDDNVKENDDDDDDAPKKQAVGGFKDAPIDYEYEVGMIDAKIEPPSLPLPEAKETLFVTMPIDSYEPYKQDDVRTFEPDPNIPIKKKFSSDPKNHSEIRDVTNPLSGLQLQKIFAGPIHIDFGNVYVNSEMTKTFRVRNDLRTAISVQLYTDRSELKKTYQKAQIIPSGQTAGFEIVLSSRNLGPIRSNIKYTINEKHQFELQVVANIEFVKIELSKTQLRMGFTDDNVEMTTKEIVKLTNNGNAAGKFKWNITSKIFSITPDEGSVPSQKSIDCVVVYKPSSVIPTATSPAATSMGNMIGNNQQVSQTVSRTEEEKLVLRVVDGIEQQLKCIGTFTEAKCQLKQQSLDLKEISVSSVIQKTFEIKNNNRLAAAFFIDETKLPEGVEISQTKGRIGADDTKPFILKFSSSKECSIKGDIVIYIRGGKTLRLPFSVNTIIPDVQIIEEKFDFGNVTTLGNPGQLNMQIINNSSIPTELVMDLRYDEDADGNNDDKDGLDCLDIICKEQADESILHSIHENDEENENEQLQQKQQLDNKNKQNNQLNDDYELDREEEARQSDEESDGETENKKQSKYYSMTIQPNQTLHFLIKFSPKSFKQYKFLMPLLLKGYGIIDGLKRYIYCRGLKPRFLIDPQILDFGKKIISAPDKQSIGKSSTLSFSNPDKYTVQWHIDQNALGSDHIFDIRPDSGEVGPGESKSITVSFNPFEPGVFERSIPLYVDDPETKLSSSYIDIQLKGEGAFPKLMFDRKEILFPVVPLGIESKCVFRITNSGYENLNLKYKIIDDISKLNIDLQFPEGKNLGITRNKIRVEATFSSKKPVSFTTRIEFYDDSERSYDIQISGTTDNCLFTNFSYFQRCQGEFKIELDHDRAPIRLELDDDDGSVDGASEAEKTGKMTEGKKKVAAPSVISAKTLSSYGSTKSSVSLLGYTPILTQYLESNAEFLCRWLNFYVLTSSIQTFPGSIIEHNGNELFEIMTYLTGKANFPFRQAVDLQTKRADKIDRLFKQYDEIIRLIKIEGALLNHIRPEHLLSYNDYLFYLKTLPEKKQQNISPSVLKMPNHRYQYISVESWTSLIYQMLKVYYLSRVNPKTFKSLPGIPPEKQQLPEYLEGSNFLSSSEALLLNWFEIHNEIIHPIQRRRIRNFDEDFQDGNIFASAIQSYVGKSCYKSFSTMKSSCGTEAEINFNAEKLLSGLNDIGMQAHLTIKDLVKPSMRESLLFGIQLFHSLPHYIPKGQPIIFACVLGEEVIKNIELTNQTLKPISYWVQLDPQNGDFSLEGDDNFVIEPKSIFKYKVRFSSRISEPVTGRIRFTNKKESNVSAAALVFELKSQIMGRISEQQWMVSAQLYEVVEKPIQITNKFAADQGGEFTIQVIQEKVKSSEEGKKKRSLGKKSLPSLSQAASPPTDLASATPSQTLATSPKTKPNALAQQEIFPSFFCQKGTIRLKKGQTLPLTIQFVPLIMDTHKCFIIFKDPAVGEFQHEMIGSVEMPPLMPDLIKFPFSGFSTIFVDEAYSHEIDIAYTNEAMIKARKYVEQLIIEKNRDKYMRGDKSQVIRPEKFNFPGGFPDSVQYDVEMNPPNPFIQIKNQFIASNPYKLSKRTQEKPPEKAPDKTPVGGGDVAKKGGFEESSSQLGGSALMGSSMNKFPFSFLFKQPMKDYKFTITLKNPLKTDIRRYRCEITVFPKPIKAALEFRVPARHSTSQDIPVINNSERDWNFKVNLIQDPKSQNAFSLPPNFMKEMYVKKKSTGILPITFTPSWMIIAEAKLTFQNPQTNDQFEYDIKGYGEEPVAEDHIVIYCKAKQITQKEIEIRNPYTDKEVVYKVETDLINCSGPSSITIKPGKKSKYILSLNPILSGQYTGSITFYENDEKYLWYTVLLNTESPKPDRCIELSTVVRQAVTFSIQIKNPLNQAVTFEVIVNGDGLIGENSLIVPSNSVGSYDLIYSPFVVGRSRGSIAFINEVLGEIWYELSMTCEDTAQTRLGVLRCELGKVEFHQIFLENPSDKEVKAISKVTNPTNFDVNPDNIILKPLSKTPVQIRYMPSNLDVTEQGEVVIQTQEIGKWKYLVFGIGIPPTKFEPRLVSVGLNKDFSTIILFKNPFKESINVTITMEAQGEDKEVFKLLTKAKKNENEKTTMQVPGMNIIQIPFSFVPREINCYYCEIVVQMNEKIEWRYPIKGVTESVVNQVIYHLKTQCRSSVEEEMKIQLPGIMSFVNSDDKFEFELDNIPEEFNTLIRQSLAIKTIKNFLTSPTDSLEFQTKFSPLKPFKQTIDLNILRQAGGRWKFKITLEATEPKEDDIINISSALHKTTSVTFKLTNKSKSFTPFTASFTPDSDAEFTVMPKEGNLESYGREGTTFVISFTPIEYGKMRQGKLIIQTEEMMWSYLVRGTLPKYNPPQAEQSMIDNKFDIDLISKSHHQNLSKNFMAENVIKMRQSQAEFMQKSIKNVSTGSLTARNKKG